MHRSPFQFPPLLGALALGAWLTGCGHPSEKAPIPEVAVTVVKPQRVTLTTELPGRVSAFLVAEVRPQVNGIVQKRAFAEGSEVRAGDLLYQIDPAPYQAALASAEAALARAQANLPAARARAERNRQLAEVNAISRQDLDDSVAAEKQAAADIQSCQAAVTAAKINLGYTRVAAPIAGRTGKSNVTVGALASAYQGQVFTTIQQLDQVYVDSPQSTAYLLQLQRNLAAGKIRGGAGQAQVKLRLEDGTPYPQAGQLKFSDVSVDPATGSLTLRMVFPNAGRALLPGMYVRAVVEEGVAEQAILVPQQGVSHDSKGEAVALVVNPSNQVEQRILKVDRAIGSAWLVTQGLQPGDRLVMEGLQSVRAGMAVKVVPFVAKAAAAAPAGN